MAKTKPVSSQWSRASGGSGAPFWTLNACGLDPANFQATQGEEMYADRLVVGSDLRPLAKAAICHGSWNGNDGETPDEEWPDMVSPCISGLSVRRKLKTKCDRAGTQIWQTNGFRLACATIFTLFFAGRMFAPKCIIDGVNIQDWLTEKYLGAFGR